MSLANRPLNIWLARKPEKQRKRELEQFEAERKDK